MPTPLYRQVLEDLLCDLREGKLKPGGKLPSEAALCARFDASRITIGRALRELKQRGMVTGVAGSGNYVRQRDTDGLVFGLLIPNLGENGIFDAICSGLAAAPEAALHALLWGHSPNPRLSLAANARELCKQFISRKVDGVFFAPLELAPDMDTANAEIAAMLDAARIPTVLLDRDLARFPQRSRYDLVGIDNRRAGYLATQHLLDTGCQDVTFLALEDAAPTVRARVAGYREAMIDYGRQAHEQTIDAINAKHGSAFVCANDKLAGLLLQKLQEQKLRVPGDVKVVGIDDIDYARLLPVPLTTIHQPCRAIGEAAIGVMLTRRENPGLLPRDIMLDCRLVVRKSSGV